MMIKIWKIYIYVTRYRMKRRDKQDNFRRNKRRALNRIRHRLYEAQKGVCRICGNPFPLSALEAHHVRGLSTRKTEYLKQRNIELLCHNCHVELHKKN